MSYANFKKVHEDESHAKFKHSNGSELKVAKKGLSPKMRKQLESLPLFAEGGDVPSSLMANDPLSDSSSQLETGIPGINININHPTPDSAPSADTSAYDQAMQTKSGMAESFPGENKQSADAAQNPDSLKFDWDEKAGLGIHRVPGMPEQASMDSTPGGLLASNGPGLDGASPHPGLAADQDPMAQQAAPMGAPAQSPMASAQPKSPQQHFEQAKQQAHADMSAEDQAWQHDLANGHITPKTYQDLFAKKDTLGKIGTIFGLLLSGAGSGLSGQPNMLMEMMNKEIKNDLDAQVQSKTNAQDFIKMNQQHDLNVANIKSTNAETALKAKTLANIQMNHAALHSLVLQAQKLPIGSPQRAQAEQTLAMLSQGVQSENFNLMDRAAAGSAYFKTMTGMGGPAGEGQQGQDAQVAQRLQFLRLNNPKMAEDLEKRWIPGVGVASTDVPKETRDKILGHQQLSAGIHDMQDFIRNNTTIIPGTPAYNQGAQKALVLQSMIREGKLGTVYREGEQPLLDKFVNSNPAGAMKMMKTMPQLKELLSSNDREMGVLAKSVGLHMNQGAEQQQAAGHPHEGKTASDGRGNKIVMQNGKWIPVSNVAKK